MLASRKTTVSQASKLPLQVSTSSIRVSGRLQRSGHQVQQCRSFRFGLWSSYLDPAFQKQVQHRHRVIKHKYAEALHRKLIWDRQHPLHRGRWGLKNFMYSAWCGHDPRPGGRWVNVDELNNVARNENSSTDPNLHEYERHTVESVGRVFGRQNARLVEQFINKSRSMYRNDPAAESSSMSSTSASSDRKTTHGQSAPASSPTSKQHLPVEQSYEGDYDIDPITNRKVFRYGVQIGEQKTDEPSLAIPVKTFKGYRSQFSNFRPPNEDNITHLDGRPNTSSYKEARKAEYSPVEHPDIRAPYKHSELSGKPSHLGQQDSVAESLKKFDNKNPPGPVYYNEPDGTPPESGESDTVADGLRKYDRKNPYGPVYYNEPDGIPPQSAQPDSVAESLKKFDDKNPPGPVYYNEPDGQPLQTDQPDSLTDGLGAYDQKNPYGPVYYNEPDGKPPGIDESDCVAESLENYDRKNPPGPVYYNEPDGKSPDQPDMVSEGLKDYDRTHEYQPFFYNESDGQVAKRSSENDSIQKSWLSDEGFSSGTASSSSQSTPPRSTVPDVDRREDLDLLRASDIRASSGIIRRPKKESDVERQSRRNNLVKDYNMFQDSREHSADETAAAKKVKDSRKLAEELEIERSELLNLTAHARGRVNARIAELEAEASVDTSNKSAPRKLTGNFVRDFPEEFMTSWTTKGSTAQDVLVPNENSVQNAKNDHNTQVSSKEWQSPGSKTPRLETSLDRKQKEEEKHHTELDPYSKEPRGLETSYANEVATNGGSEPIFVSTYGCDGHMDAARQKAKNEKRNQDRDLVREIRGIYEAEYGTIDSKHRQVPEASRNSKDSIVNNVPVAKIENELRESQYTINDLNLDTAKILASRAPETETADTVEESSPATEPTVYKILAYDPIMQEINIAETTSIVTDNAGVLTPAEALLRLSNPAKFFPHFQPLQAAGYEIATGSGDVLVFRKVRDGPPPTSEYPKQDSTRISSYRAGGKQINPIDGMKIVPQSANFASPTGFVGEGIQMNDDIFKPRFKSNIDVRREEDVFSGRENGWQDGEKSAPRRTGKKLLVGAAWVAGCSYAAGVVAEFFRSGGVDGQGPVGF